MLRGGTSDISAAGAPETPPPRVGARERASFSELVMVSVSVAVGVGVSVAVVVGVVEGEAQGAAHASTRQLQATAQPTAPHMFSQAEKGTMTS
jgi:hypothetical protein